jgi:hypothetical protein
MAKVPVKGTTVIGRVRGYDETKTLWLFVRSPDDGKHWLTGRIIVTGVRFARVTGEVGSSKPSEVGKLYEIEIVETKGSTTTLLDTSYQKAAGGDVFFSTLPDGATVVAHQVVQRQ